MPLSDSGFEIEMHDDGTCDITRDRRAFFYDCADLQEAESMIRRQFGVGTDYLLVETDGYRTVHRV